MCEEDAKCRFLVGFVFLFFGFSNLDT